MDNQTNNPQADVELTLRKLRFLWLGTLGSIAGIYVLTLATERPQNLQPNETIFLILVAVAVTTTLVSFVVKKRLFAQAEAQQQVQLVQQGFVVASAITEVGALLGVLDHFSFGDPYYFVLFIISACGQLLHFPRRDQVLHATYKTSTF